VPEETPEESVLGTAARAIRLHRLGDPDAAERQCRRLIASKNRWRSVLGSFTLAWLPDFADEPIVNEAWERARALEDDDLHARLLLRLLAVAVERPLPQLAVPLYEAALRSAPERSHIRAIIQQVGFNLLEKPIESGWGPFEPDPLIEQPWLTSRLGGPQRSPDHRGCESACAQPVDEPRPLRELAT